MWRPYAEPVPHYSRQPGRRHLYAAVMKTAQRPREKATVKWERREKKQVECSGKKVRAGSGILKRSNYFEINLQNCLTGAAPTKKIGFKTAVIGLFKHTEL